MKSKHSDHLAAWQYQQEDILEIENSEILRICPDPFLVSLAGAASNLVSACIVKGNLPLELPLKNLRFGGLQDSFEKNASVRLRNVLKE